MVLYAVREFIPYESQDIIKLFTTKAKAEAWVKSAENAEQYYELSIEEVVAE